MLRCPSPQTAATVVLTGLLTGCGTEPQTAPPPLEIPVAKLVPRDTEITIDLVGQTRGSTDVPIRARVQGVLETMDFREGERVEQGDLLYTIDPAPFRSKVVEAEGRLAEARTLLVKSKADLDRIRPLAEMDAVSQQDLDGAVAQHEAAIGNLQAAEAHREQAEIEFSYTRIQAPTNGFIGISLAEVGEFVGAPPNSVILNYVSLTDPIRVRFAINERDYLAIAAVISEARRSDPNELIQQRGDLKLILADGSIHQHAGSIVAFDAAINPSTGTFTLEADFANPDDIVLAGQFARVRGVIESRENALVVPLRAISELQGMFRVFVVGPDDVVSVRTIEPGPQVGNARIVESGLEPGERVAVEGILRLSEGARVTAKPVDPDTFEPLDASNEGATD